jgi:hypothetical protein
MCRSTNEASPRCSRLCIARILVLHASMHCQHPCVAHIISAQARPLFSSRELLLTRSESYPRLDSHPRLESHPRVSTHTRVSRRTPHSRPHPAAKCHPSPRHARRWGRCGHSRCPSGHVRYGSEHRDRGMAGAAGGPLRSRRGTSSGSVAAAATGCPWARLVHAPAPILCLCPLRSAAKPGPCDHGAPRRRAAVLSVTVTVTQSCKRGARIAAAPLRAAGAVSPKRPAEMADMADSVSSRNGGHGGQRFEPKWRTW